MPERRADLLKVPFKQYEVRVKNARLVIEKYLGDTQQVSADELADILSEVFVIQGEDHRQDWLEIERWAGRLRDELGDPYQPPTTAIAVFTSNAPVTVGSGTLPPLSITDSGWSEILNEAPVMFRLGQYPTIVAAGVYSITHTYQYSILHPAPDYDPKVEHAEVQAYGQTDSAGSGGGYFEHPRPIFSVFNGPGSEMVGGHNWVKMLTVSQVPYPLWSLARFRCSTNTTGVTHLSSVTFRLQRLPIPYY